jgi:membrane-associated protease RseP (regulator of RpoE activity)
MNETQDQKVPPLRPEAYVVRGDRTLAAMVLLICTLGGVGIGFGTALYMLRVSSLGVAEVRPHKVMTLTWLGTNLDARAHVQGAKVKQVWEGSPAERAGIQGGDIILRVDDAWVTNADDLVREVRDRDPGDRAMLLIERGGQTMRLRTFLTSF